MTRMIDLNTTGKLPAAAEQGREDEVASGSQWALMTVSVLNSKYQ